MSTSSITPPRADAGAFTIVSYNIRHGEDMRGRLELRAPGWVANSVVPRFVGLQEVDQKTSRVGGADTCAILVETTGLHATFAKAISFDGGDYGNALLSREKPVSVRRIPLPGEEPRVLLLCEFDDCWVGVTHLAVDSDAARIESVAIIRDAVAACAPKPVFLMGDWNATPDSPVLDGMRSFMTILSDETTASFHGTDFDPTEKHNPAHCIDYIAVDSAHRAGYILRGRHVIEQRSVSDHAPQVVEVVPASGAAKPEGAFTVATFNVRCPGDRGELIWYRRMPRVSQIVRDHGFDIFGVQECVNYQAAILDTDLMGFGRVGCTRNADRTGGEAMFIYYRKNRFELLDGDTFWLSCEPSQPGTRLPGSACLRICTWALLRDSVTGRRLRFFNTHLDHVSTSARLGGMRVIMGNGLRRAIDRGESVILTGDFNEEAGEGAAIELAKSALADTQDVSETPHAGPALTFHGYRDEPKNRIDFIFASRGMRVLAHATIDDKPEGAFASDHYPVAAIVELPPDNC